MTDPFAVFQEKMAEAMFEALVQAMAMANQAQPEAIPSGNGSDESFELVSQKVRTQPQRHISDGKYCYAYIHPSSGAIQVRIRGSAPAKDGKHVAVVSTREEAIRWVADLDDALEWFADAVRKGAFKP